MDPHGAMEPGVARRDAREFTLVQVVSGSLMNLPGFWKTRYRLLFIAWLLGSGLWCGRLLTAASPDQIISYKHGDADQTVPNENARRFIFTADPDPRYFAAKPGSLAKARARFQGGDKTLARAVRNLVGEADEALRIKPPSVTEKSKLPPSGDRHDYMSLAPYYWPDPKTITGLPYVRHDGRVNPESRDAQANDGPRVKLMGTSIETLALAFCFTTNEIYAAHAAAFARAWFITPSTRMNAHFKFAQAVQGENDGRGTGIIEARSIAQAADALGLLAGAKSWTAADRQAFDAWIDAFLNWLLTSKAGQDEHAARNNHGTIFDVQTARLALHLGRNDLARRILEEAKRRRIAVQIEPDGRQPLELVRTASFSYSRFNLEALAELATLGEHAGVDLWHFATPDGRSIRRALEFMLPYLENPAAKWPFEQIKDRHDADFLPILRAASLAYDAPEWERFIGKHPDASGKRFQVLFAQ